ncbi:MAG: hypothetical protein GQ531_10110 [Sulfurovum sp.]|nr:hypothetical protein [Sulfurovum sp.]
MKSVKDETQVDRLTQMMQKQRFIPSYEVLLPLVSLSSKAYGDLALNDVLMLGLEKLELLLVKEGMIYAKAKLLKFGTVLELEIVELSEKPINPSDSKKYEVLKLSFGFVQCKVLEKDSRLRAEQINFKEVSLILKDIKIAEATLVLVDEKIALHIDKVEK